MYCRVYQNTGKEIEDRYKQQTESYIEDSASRRRNRVVDLIGNKKLKENCTMIGKLVLSGF
jgi:hypothetical protein